MTFLTAMTGVERLGLDVIGITVCSELFNRLGHLFKQLIPYFLCYHFNIVLTHDT